MAKIESYALFGLTAGAACAIAAAPVAGVAVGVYGAISLVASGTAIGAGIGLCKAIDPKSDVIDDAAKMVYQATKASIHASTEAFRQWDNFTRCAAIGALSGGTSAFCHWQATSLGCTERLSPPVECSYLRPLTAAFLSGSIACFILGSTLLSKAITGSNKAATCENARRAAVAAFHEAL